MMKSWVHQGGPFLVIPRDSLAAGVIRFVITERVIFLNHEQLSTPPVCYMAVAQQTGTNMEPR